MKFDDNKINDFSVYLNRMHGPIKDKLFFLLKLEDIEVIDRIESVVDFGCADGELFKFLPDSWIKIGVDISSEMLLQAKENFPNGKYVKYVNEANKIKKDNSLLILNSVLHELYSYESEKSIDDFWKDVNEGNYDYISIRDMCYSLNNNFAVEQELIKKINSSSYKELFDDYCKVLGKEEYELTQKDAVQFLLKYRYKENWDREVRENYFGIDQRELMSRLLPKYEIVYLDMFTLPYIKDIVYKDFGYSLKDSTHIKAIARKI